jgi:hypothetical protein
LLGSIKRESGYIATQGINANGIFVVPVKNATAVKGGFDKRKSILAGIRSGFGKGCRCALENAE